MQRYLRPDLLDGAGLTDFDCWAATFGEVVTGIDLSPDGSRFRMKSRFARFRNVPELLRMWHVSADIKTAEDLQLPTPVIATRDDGQRAPETVVVEPSDELRDLVADLGRRADLVKVRGGPGTDNMLKIATDGRLAALDLRLTGATTDATTKLDIAADRIAAIWRAHRDTRYPSRDGNAHPRPGALQLVFSDLGTPNEQRWDVYHELRDLLHHRGLPPGTVRFVHEARNDIEKAARFAAAREGRIAVLVGSTQRMGVGTNVQLRAVALHHLDCPWRPADLAQRDGRILRQGNDNPEVQILRYVTEGVLRRLFLADRHPQGRVHRPGHARPSRCPRDRGCRRHNLVLRRGQSPRHRRSPCPGEGAPRRRGRPAGTPRTRASPRPGAARPHGTERREPRRHPRNRGCDRRRRHRDPHRHPRGRLPRHHRRRHPHQPRRHGAGDPRSSEPRPHPRRASPQLEARPIGVSAGFPVQVAARRVGETISGVQFALDGVPRSSTYLTIDEIRDADPTGLTTRIENRITGLDRLARQLSDEITDTRREAGRARAQQDLPFTHAGRLTRARSAAADLHRQMNELAAAPATCRPPGPGSAAPAQPDPRRPRSEHPPVHRPGVPPSDIHAWSSDVSRPPGHVSGVTRRASLHLRLAGSRWDRTPADRRAGVLDLLPPALLTCGRPGNTVRRIVTRPSSMAGTRVRPSRGRTCRAPWFASQPRDPG